MLFNSSYEVSISLIPKIRPRCHKKKLNQNSYKSVSLMNAGTKILDKILTVKPTI